jgi:hypothetical protein
MNKLEDLISNSKITPPLNLDVAIKTIDMDHSCMKDKDLKTFKNELLQKSIKQYNVTYKSDQKHNHPNTPILLFDNGIIFLGHEPKLFGILGDTPTWKFIFYCDIIEGHIGINSIVINLTKKYTFENIDEDSIVHIAKSIQNAGIIGKFHVIPTVRSKLKKHNENLQRAAKDANSQRAAEIKLEKFMNSVSKPLPHLGGRRRKTKRAKKNKRRTRRARRS